MKVHSTDLQPQALAAAYEICGQVVVSDLAEDGTRIHLSRLWLEGSLIT